MKNKDILARLKERYPAEKPAVFNYVKAREEMLSLAAKVKELETALKYYKNLEADDRLEILSVSRGFPIFQPTGDGIQEMSFTPADNDCIDISVFTSFEKACEYAEEYGWPCNLI